MLGGPTEAARGPHKVLEEHPLSWEWSLLALILLHIWTPFNKLGRIYGKEIRERAKKSASSFVYKIREIGTMIYPWLLWQVSLSTAKPATTSPSYLADF